MTEYRSYENPRKIESNFGYMHAVEWIHLVCYLVMVPSWFNFLLQIGFPSVVYSCEYLTFNVQGALYGSVGFGCGIVGQGIVNMIMNAKRYVYPDDLCCIILLQMPY